MIQDFLSPQDRSPDLEAMSRVRRWVSELIPVPPAATVLVKEVRCHEEGCPPVETIIALLAADQPAIRWTVHAPVAEVTKEGLASALGQGESLPPSQLG